ncbi:hypothetical protein N665_0422s0029 [Sinapis alba]|nr:hypothetical protein N665_0422s0029 [Sinapis alba]
MDDEGLTTYEKIDKEKVSYGLKSQFDSKPCPPCPRLDKVIGG